MKPLTKPWDLFRQSLHLLSEKIEPITKITLFGFFLVSFFVFGLEHVFKNSEYVSPVLFVITFALCIPATLSVVSYIFVSCIRVLDGKFENDKVTLRIVLKDLRYIVPGFFVTTLATSIAVVGGGLFFILPGLYLFGALLFSQTIVTVEDKKYFDAMHHSWKLVHGRWFSVFLRYAYLLIGIIFIDILFYFVINNVTGLFTGPVKSESVKTSIEIFRSIFSATVLTPIVYTYIYLLYKDIKDKGEKKVLPEQSVSILKVLTYATLVTIVVLALSLFVFAIIS